MINEDAPTMSAGTGGFSGSSAANGPVAGFDSMMGVGKLTKKKPKRRKYVKEEGSNASVDLEQKTAMALPFRVSYKDEAMDFILYGKSEQAIRLELRKIFRPEKAKYFSVKRLYPNQVIKFYWDKRQASLK